MSVTIGLPYTDQGDYLDLAIRSVLSQSFVDWELILIGDGPDERTKAVAQRFNDPRIRHFENKARIGLAATLNRISKLARFPLIARMDGDDIMHPNRIELQKKKFEQITGLDVLGSRAYLIDTESNIAGIYKERPDLPCSVEGFLKSNAFTHPTIMGKREWFLTNPYDESLLRGEDKELWLRTWSYSKFYKMGEKLMFYRRTRRMSGARMRRDEVYNRLIMRSCDPRRRELTTIIRRDLSSYAKQLILGAIGDFGLSPLFFNTKWDGLPEAELGAAQLIIEKLKSPKVENLHTDVVAATVTYGRRSHLLEQTVDAALKAGASRVIVVDNGSEAESCARLSELSQANSHIQVVRLPINVGSAAGFATAVRSFLQTEADYLWLLDDDNVAEPTCLQELLRAEAKLSASQAGAPVAVCATRPSSAAHLAIAAGKSVNLSYPPPGSFMYFDVLQRLSRLVRGRHMRKGTSPSLVVIPYAPYGGLLASRTALAAVGLPDSKLGLYEDDTEYTSRFHTKGGVVALCRPAVVHDIDNKWSEASGQKGLAGLILATDTKRTYFAVRNRVAFDLGRTSSVGLYVRFKINEVIFRAALVFLAARYRRSSQAARISAALTAGLGLDFSQQFCGTVGALRRND